MIFWQVAAIVAVVFLASVAGSLITIGKEIGKCERTMSALFAVLVLYAPTKKKEDGYADRSPY